MDKIKVKNFWITPENPSINNFSEFSFGYTNNGKDFEYKISANPVLSGSVEALHKIFWIILESKRGSYLPWNHVPPAVKSKLIISNLKDPQTSFLSELTDRVACRLSVLNKLLRWI